MSALPRRQFRSRGKPYVRLSSQSSNWAEVPCPHLLSVSSLLASPCQPACIRPGGPGVLRVIQVILLGLRSLFFGFPLFVARCCTWAAAVHESLWSASPRASTSQRRRSREQRRGCSSNLMPVSQNVPEHGAAASEPAAAAAMVSNSIRETIWSSMSGCGSVWVDASDFLGILTHFFWSKQVPLPEGQASRRASA